MQPFWMQSNAQASANEQAEMAAFCQAYAETAAAVSSASLDDCVCSPFITQHGAVGLLLSTLPRYYQHGACCKMG